MGRARCPQRAAVRLAGRWPSALWLGLFLAQSALVWARLCLPHRMPGDASWPEALLLLLALGGLLAAQARQVPGQNVAMAAVIILGLAGLFLGLGWRAGIALAPVSPQGASVDRQRLWLPWAAALWLLALLASREVARQILRPRRASANYGFEVVALTVLLLTLFLLAFQPFAAGVVAQAAATFVILFAATPWLIDKRGVELPPPRRPVLVWAIAHLLFLTAAVLQHRWALAALAASCALLLTALALRGAAAPTPLRR